jgi:hypothetical protein
MSGSQNYKIKIKKFLPYCTVLSSKLINLFDDDSVLNYLCGSTGNCVEKHYLCIMKTEKEILENLLLPPNKEWAYLQ